MKILITGAAGMQGASAIFSFLKERDVSQIVLTDINEDILKERVARFADKRLTAKYLDITDRKSTINEFKKADVVCNTSILPIQGTEAALEAGVDIVSTGANWPLDHHERQFKFNDGFKQKGITNILSMGIFYGMVNLQAAYATNKMESVESIVVWDACVDVVPPEEHTRPLYWGYTPTGPLRKVARNALSIINGKMLEIPPLSNKEVIGFKDPIGPLEVYSVTDAVESLLHYVKEKGLKNGDIKIGFNASDDAKWRFLAELGFSSREPINVKGQMVVPEDVFLALIDKLSPEKKKPSDFRSELIACVKGVEAGEQVEYRVGVRPSEKLHQELKQKGIVGSYGSGIATALGSLLVARGQTKKGGIFFPDAAIPADLFLKDLTKLGYELEINRKIEKLS